jgi:mitogen-activated protein kinase kinase 1
MPAKRPAGLSKLNDPPMKQEDASVKITDTMTLVVKDADGMEVRVKESGRLPVAGGSTSVPLPTAVVGKPKIESLLDRILFEDLKVLDMLGAGSQGKVRKACHKVTGELYALKSIAFSDDKDATRDVLRAELKRLAALQHPNIVTSYEAYFREGKLYIVLELMDCGTLTHLIQKCGKKGIPERILSYISTGFLRGLRHLHNSGVVHRDIKPGNLLLSSAGDVKISDFGVAKDFSKQQNAETLAPVGSTPYMSPERVKGEPYSFLCDVWSVGLSIAEAAIGQYPFENLKGNTFALCQAIANGTAAPAWHLAPRPPSAELKDFVSQCLRPVQSRPSADTLLSHPFLALAANLEPAAAGYWMNDPLGKSIEEVELAFSRGELQPLSTRVCKASPNYVSSSPMGGASTTSPGSPESGMNLSSNTTSGIQTPHV